MTRTCQTCFFSCAGFFCPKRLYCCEDKLKEVEHEGVCEKWKEGEEKSHS